jgi:hypothetical protein
MGRLKGHLRDCHKGLWDRFSVYLTSDAEHIKELESLLLRIIGTKPGLPALPPKAEAVQLLHWPTCSQRGAL